MSATKLHSVYGGTPFGTARCGARSVPLVLQANRRSLVTCGRCRSVLDAEVARMDADLAAHRRLVLQLRRAEARS